MKHIDKAGSSTFNVVIAPFSLSILGDDNDVLLWLRLRMLLRFKLDTRAQIVAVTVRNIVECSVQVSSEFSWSQVPWCKCMECGIWTMCTSSVWSWTSCRWTSECTVKNYRACYRVIRSLVFPTPRLFIILHFKTTILIRQILFVCDFFFFICSRKYNIMVAVIKGYFCFLSGMKGYFSRIAYRRSFNICCLDASSRIKVGRPMMSSNKGGMLTWA